jgi:predicted O-methyltransferase YrrM
MNSQPLDSIFDRAIDSLSFRLQRFAKRCYRSGIRRRLQRLGLENAYAIHTWTRPEELEALYQLAANCRKGANIVELGSYLGASTCFLAAGADAVGGNVTAIDLWNNETIAGGHRDTFAEFQRNTAGAAHLIRPIRKRTQDLTSDDIGKPIDFAFIDADHSYEATRSDAEFIIPQLAPHGIIAFHDATTFAGVGRAVAELLQTGNWCLGGQAASLVWIRPANWKNWPPELSSAS